MDTIHLGKKVKPRIVFSDDSPQTQARRGSHTEHTENSIADDIKFKRTQNVSEKILRYGKNNNLPAEIMKLILGNPLLLALISFKVDVAIGDGLMTYKIKGYQGKSPIVEVVQDSQVQDFLANCEADNLWETVFTDYYTFGMFDCEYIATRGGLVDSSFSQKIALANAIDASTIRPAKPKTDFEKVSAYHLNVDWKTANDSNTLVLPAFRKDKVQRKSIYHVNEYVSGNAYIGLPKWIGAKEYIEYLNQIPTFKKALIQNIATPSWHVKIPSEYFKINFPNHTDAQRKEERAKLEQDIEDFLQGAENAGKPLITYIWKDSQGRDVCVEIIALKNEIPDTMFNEDFDQLFQITCSAAQVPPSLASILVPGKLSSGSDILNSWNAYIARIARHRQKILSIIRNVQFVNGWDKDLLFDFRTRELRTTDYAPAGFTENSPQ